MKKVLSLLLATAMLCSAANAYDISEGQMNAAPDAVQADLANKLDTLGLNLPKVTGSTQTNYTAALGEQIKIFTSGTKEGTQVIAARLDTIDNKAAIEASTEFGATCGAIISLVSPNTSSAIVNTALKLDNTVYASNGTDNLRAYYTNKALFTYEVTPSGVRFSALAYPDMSNGIQLIVNDQFVSLDVPPRIIEGRTLVPLRGIFEQLGATAQWDQSTLTATMTRGDSIVKVTIGSQTAWVNGEKKTLDVPAQLISSRTLVPVRFIAEALGAQVGWNNSPQTVILSTR